jgi:hypothetical protein
MERGVLSFAVNAVLHEPRFANASFAKDENDAGVCHRFRNNFIQLFRFGFPTYKRRILG